MYCKNCGAEINNNAVVCVKCGVPVIPVKNSYNGSKELAPKRTAAFVCGLLGFLFWAIPVVGLALSCIGVALASKSTKLTRKNPDRYDGIGLVTAGKVLGIIGIVIGILCLIWTIIVGIALGDGLFTWFELIEDTLNL